MAPSPVPTLLITGPVGGGKTSVAEAVSDRLRALRVAHALIDVDWLAQLSPAPADDPYNQRLALQNLAAVWPNYAEAGATHLVLDRVVETMDELSDYEVAVPGAQITVCRLRARIETVHARLHGRDRGEWLAWSLERSAELAGIMERNAIGHHVIDTDELSIEAVAAEVLRASGWPPAPARPGGPAYSYGSRDRQPTYESSLPPREPWGRDEWGDAD